MRIQQVEPDDTLWNLTLTGEEASQLSDEIQKLKIAAESVSWTDIPALSELDDNLGVT